MTVNKDTAHELAHQFMVNECPPNNVSGHCTDNAWCESHGHCPHYSGNPKCLMEAVQSQPFTWLKRFGLSELVGPVCSPINKDASIRTHVDPVP